MKIFVKFILVLTMFLFVININAKDSTGKLDKIKYYKSEGKNGMAINNLNEFNLKDLTRNELKETIKELEKLGDSYTESGKFKEAQIVYKKIADNSPNYWQVYNKIENLRREQNSILFSIKNFLVQTISLGKNTDSFFLFFSLVFSSIYFSSIFVFFLFAMILFFKYFKIFSHDAIRTSTGNLAIKKIIVFSILLLWPVILFSGWMIYPFLISGLFWVYLEKSEKRSITVLIIIVFVFSIMFSFRSYIQNSMRTENYNIVKAVEGGRYFKKNEYSKFDNELKIYLAYTYYENGDNNSSLDILLSTGDSYKSSLKYNLLGNIYYSSGNLEQSMKYFKNSLDINEKDATALYNFSLVLAAQKNSKVFDSYAVRFPRIKKIKREIGHLKEIDIVPGLLKRRALTSSDETFNVISFTISILKELFKLPVIYFSLILLLYIYIMRMFFPRLGESTHCSKCSKIIKENTVDASNRFCSECYQLFMIKDVIFLEAKVAKEEKIRKKKIISGITLGAFSIIFPGLNLAFKEKYMTFILFSLVFYATFCFSQVGKTVFDLNYSIHPIIFNIAFIILMVFYLFINLYSVKGDTDGF